MKARLMAGVCLLSILALLPLWEASPASADSVILENQAPVKFESTIRPLINNLRSGGYEVASGYFRLYNINDCNLFSYRIMGSCFLNNPAAPYILPVLPTWPDEWVDQATVNALGETEPGTSGTYRLDQREAIVILGKLPPEAKYFGVQSYLFTRQGDYDTTSAMYLKMKDNYPPALVNTFFHYVINNPNRIVSFDSLSNAINNVVIEQQSGAVFDQLRYFIITPDQAMDARLRKALGKLSISQKDIFTEPIPGNLRIGLGEESDEFTTILRFAEPKDSTLADEWRSELPLFILRIRPARSNWQPVPYNPVVLDKRYALDEFPLKPDLDNLVKAVFGRWGQAYDPNLVIKQHDFQFEFGLVGPECEKIGMDCLADNQDAAYQAPVGGFLLDVGKIYAYVGVLGTETGNATYVGLGINNALKKLGVANVRGDDLIGSAELFDHQVNHTDKFFVHYFARSCAGLSELNDDNCTEITPTMIPACTDPTGAGCTRAMFTERDYIFPRTRRGPDSEFVLPGRVIVLEDPRP